MTARGNPWALVLAGGDGTLLGAGPDRRETGYGYIAPGTAHRSGAQVYGVAAFHEKPSRAVGARLVRGGGLWNAFVMVARVARVVALLRGVRLAAVAALEAAAVDGEALDAVYARLAPWNFSRDFLARVTDHLVVFRADHLGWSDWGTPDAIERSLVAMGVVPPWLHRAPVAARRPVA